MIRAVFNQDFYKKQEGREGKWWRYDEEDEDCVRARCSFLRVSSCMFVCCVDLRALMSHMRAATLHTYVCGTFSDRITMFYSYVV